MFHRFYCCLIVPFVFVARFIACSYRLYFSVVVLLARLAFDASLFMSLSRAVDAIQRWIGLGILSNLHP